MKEPDCCVELKLLVHSISAHLCIKGSYWFKLRAGEGFKAKTEKYFKLYYSFRIVILFYIVLSDRRLCFRSIIIISDVN